VKGKHRKPRGFRALDMGTERMNVHPPRSETAENKYHTFSVSLGAPTAIRSTGDGNGVISILSPIWVPVE